MQAADAFLESKSNILSPSTKRLYKTTLKTIPVKFKLKYVNTITSLDVQKLVNDWSARLAPKTVSNYANFVTAILKSVDSEVKPPKLPQKKQKLAGKTTQSLEIWYNIIRRDYYASTFTTCPSLSSTN